MPDPSPGGSATEPGSNATNEHLGPKLDALLQAMYENTFKVEHGTGRVVNEIRNQTNVLSDQNYQALLSHHRREGLLEDIRAAQQGLRDLFTSGEAMVAINWPGDGGGNGGGGDGGDPGGPGGDGDGDGDGSGDQSDYPECIGFDCDEELEELDPDDFFVYQEHDVSQLTTGLFGGGGGSCPAAGWGGLSIRGASISMPWGALCAWMQLLSAIILMCGYLVAGQIVMRI